MAIYTNGGTRITDVKVSSGTKINYVYDATNNQYVWARIVEIIFKMPWQMFSSWSIVRTNTREPSASLNTAVASNSLNSGLVNGGEVKISGYCGDTYKLTRTVITGYSGLVENGKTYSVGESNATFEETGGAAIQLSKPTVSVTREGADVIATITNNNSYECHLYALCSESEYAVVDENWY